MQRWNNLVSLAGRVLIAALFLAGAVQKAIDSTPAGEMLEGWGLPFGLVWVAMAYNLGAAVALILGIALPPVALSLALYCMGTSFFHLVPDDPWQMSIFVKNWAIAGGCLVLAGQGGGAWRLRFASQGVGSR